MKAYLSFIVMAVLMFGCSMDEGDFMKGQGMLTFSLSADTTGINGSQPTKSTISDFQEFSNTDLYLIEILEGEQEEIVKTYAQYKDMPEVIELESGNYKMRASYGELKAAAFDTPRFEGKTDFLIKDQMSTSLDIICTLANARLTISYSDSLKMTYPTHSVIYSTDFTGEEPLVFEQEEKRSGWFQVSEIGTDLKGKLTVKDPLGAEQSFAVNIPSVKPKDNVNIVFNSAPNAQSVIVKVTINEEVIDVPVYVYIPDYMLPVDAPVLKTEGFSSGDPIVLAKSDTDPEAKIEMNVPGTIDNCYLTIWDDTNAEIKYDLANLSANEKVAVEALGLDLPEIFRKKKISLDFNPVIALLPRIADGIFEVKNYNYKLEVVDSLVNANTSDPIMLSIKMIPEVAPKINLSDDFISSDPVQIAEGGILFKGGAKYNPRYEAEIQSTANITAVILKIKDASGNVIEYDLKNDATPTGVTYDNTTNIVSYKESVCALTVDPNSVKRQEYELTVQTEYNGQTYEDVKTLIVDIIPPSFNMQMSDDSDGNGDVFAKRAILRAFAQTCDASKMGFQVFKNGNWEDVEGAVEVNGNMASITTTGLEIETKYTVRAKYGSHLSETTTITTEGTGVIPNAGFEEWSEKWIWKTAATDLVLRGGRDIYAFYPYEDGSASSAWWSTNNDMPTQKTGETSWYYASYPCVVPTNATSNRPSYYRLDKPINAKTGNTAMEISTVGWGEGNRDNAAPNKRTVGSLFIGSYNAFTQTLGHEFHYRPTAVHFWYKFHSYNSEKAKVYAVVYDQNKEELARGELLISNSVDTYVKGEFEINYLIMKKAQYISIVFLSSSSSSASTEYIRGSASAWNGYGDSRHIGSVLTVDDVELIYE